MMSEMLLLGVFSSQAMLDLGASPDYKDRQGLTPLYHMVTVGGDPSCCEVLLRAHASVGCHDENGWHEIHQVGLSFTSLSGGYRWIKVN